MKTFTRATLLTLALGLLAACGGTETPVALARQEQQVVVSPICGDAVCSSGEDAFSCGGDCFCGNGRCDATETDFSCASDCAPGCGDGICADTESTESCTGDCETCVDMVCEPKRKRPSNPRY
ncbi:MAG TPA: hypothetical protein VFO83_03590 [Aggregicoccus sp.]|nr:hypothetical protein [Aggregicoccus sp.]